MEGKIKSKTLKKAIDILNCFNEKQPLGVTEISNKLGLYKSNVYDLLTTFTAMGYLEQDPETGKYYLGIGIYLLSKSIRDRFGFRKILVGLIQEISDEVGETTSLTVPIKDQVYYMDVAMPSSRNLGVYGSFTNSMDNLYATSCGKAILAYMPEDFVAEYLKRDFIPYTKNTITDPEVLRKQLIEIRERGYATDDMENTIGLNCVGVPILSAETGKALVAISVSGPTERMTPERCSKIAQLIQTKLQKVKDRI